MSATGTIWLADAVKRQIKDPRREKKGITSDPSELLAGRETRQLSLMLEPKRVAKRRPR
jgi:hypothetical protein